MSVLRGWQECMSVNETTVFFILLHRMQEATVLVFYYKDRLGTVMPKYYSQVRQAQLDPHSGFHIHGQTSLQIGSM